MTEPSEPSGLHCFIVRLPPELDAAVEEHRNYLQELQSYSATKRGVIPLAEAARDLMRRGLRRTRPKKPKQQSPLFPGFNG